jgi:hypothetical protein
VIRLKIFLIILVLFFSILGVVDAIRFFLFKIFTKKKIEILNPNEAEFIIRDLGTHCLWNSDNTQLICFDSSESKETQKIIDIASKEFDLIEFKKKI